MSSTSDSLRVQDSSTRPWFLTVCRVLHWIISCLTAYSLRGNNVEVSVHAPSKLKPMVVREKTMMIIRVLKGTILNCCSCSSVLIIPKEPSSADSVIGAVRVISAVHGSQTKNWTDSLVLIYLNTNIEDTVMSSPFSAANSAVIKCRKDPWGLRSDGIWWFKNIFQTSWQLFSSQSSRHARAREREGDRESEKEKVVVVVGCGVGGYCV